MKECAHTQSAQPDSVYYTKYESNHSIFTTTSDCWHNNVQSLLWTVFTLSLHTNLWHSHVAYTQAISFVYTTIKLTNL